MKKKATKESYIVLTVLDYAIAAVILVVMVILRLFALPFSLLKGLFTAQLPIEDGEIEVKLINAIRQWVANHQNDIADATETFGEKESYFIKITPKLNNAATLSLEVGYPKYLRVSIENFGIEFGEEQIDDGEKLIQHLLLSYENGEYYLKKWVYEGELIDKCLVILIKKKQYTSQTDELKLTRKWFSTVKIKKFMPIAAVEE
jgi:hypothetical protein